MRPRHYVLLIALALLAGFAGRAVSDRLLAPLATPASAAQGDRDEWEYCAVTRAQYGGLHQAGTYWIAYFRPPRGLEVVDVKAAPSENAQGKAISKLGSEGWVMVGQGPLEIRPTIQPGPQGTPTALYFRRARRD